MDILRRGASLLVAYQEANPDHILGWVLAEDKAGTCVVHYLHVTDRAFQQTLPALLLNALPGTKPGFITHHLPLKVFRKWKLIPEIARRQRL